MRGTCSYSARRGYALLLTSSACDHRNHTEQLGQNSTEGIVAQLTTAGITAAAIHGDKDSAERHKIMFAFRGNNIRVPISLAELLWL